MKLATQRDARLMFTLNPGVQWMRTGEERGVALTLLHDSNLCAIRINRVYFTTEPDPSTAVYRDGGIDTPSVRQRITVHVHGVHPYDPRSPVGCCAYNDEGQEE